MSDSSQLSEIESDSLQLSKLDRESQILHITYMWNLKKKNDTKEFIYKTETDSQI